MDDVWMVAVSVGVFGLIIGFVGELLRQRWLMWLVAIPCAIFIAGELLILLSGTTVHGAGTFVIYGLGAASILGGMFVGGFVGRLKR